MAFTATNLCYQPVASVTFNSVDTGATFDGVTVSWTSTYAKEFNDQTYGPVFKNLVQREFNVKWNAHEAHQANVSLSIGMATSALSGGTLSLNNTQIADASLVITGAAGTGPSSKVRTWTFTKASPTGTGSIQIVKNGTARPMMEFEGLYDTSTSKFGTCVDV